MGQKNNDHDLSIRRDEAIRLTALDRALQVSSGEYALTLAAKFEDYLRNGEQVKDSFASPFVSEASEATKATYAETGSITEDVFGGRIPSWVQTSDDRKAWEAQEAEKINRTVWNSAIDAVFALGGDRSNRETFDLGTIRNAVKGLYRR